MSVLSPSRHSSLAHQTPFGSPAAGPAPDTATEPALILVVDDEPHIVDLLSLLLEDEGYRVRQAANGRDALNVIEQETPRLIISDIMMPGMNGIELVRRLHHDDRDPKFILMSAVSHRAPTPEVPFIQKPFDIDDMLTMVDGALGEEAQSA